MTGSKKAEYKKQLEFALEELTKELQSIATLNDESKDWVATPPNASEETADENIEADLVEEWNERRATVSQLETRYQNVLKALDKIKNDQFGICEISGEEIEEERLDANPAARTNLANIEREKELSL